MAKKSLFYLSILFIFYGTLIPFHFSADPGLIHYNILRINWIPLWDAYGRRIWSVPDMVQNIVLFIPLGLSGSFVLKRRSAVVFLGLSISTLCEILQLFTPDRYTATTDIAMNTVGTGVGVFLATASRATWGHLMENTQWMRALGHESFRMVLVLLVLCMVSFWQPFDFTLDVGSVWPKVKDFLLMPLRVTPPTSEPFYFMLFAMLGLYVCAFLERLGYAAGTQRCLFAMLMVGGLALFLEFSQFIIESRMPQLQDAFSGIAGGIAGALFYGYYYSGSRNRAVVVRFLVLLACFTLVLVIMELSPFRFTANASHVNLVPFYPYYARTNALSLSDSIEMVATGMLIGLGTYSLASRVSRSLIPIFLSTVYFLALMGALEYAQRWVIGRYPDVTDVILTGFGIVLGAMVWREWVKRDPYSAHLDCRLT